MPMVREVELINSVDDRETCQSIAGRVYPKFEILDTRIAAHLKIIQNSNFKNKIHLEEQKAQKEGRFLRDR